MSSSAAPALGLGLPPLAVAYSEGSGDARSTDPYTPTQGIVVELDDSVAGFLGRLARQDKNTANVSAPNSLRSSLCVWRVDKYQVLGAAKEELCQRSYTTVPIYEGPEVAHS